MTQKLVLIISPKKLLLPFYLVFSRKTDLAIMKVTEYDIKLHPPNNNNNN